MFPPIYPSSFEFFGRSPSFFLASSSSKYHLACIFASTSIPSSISPPFISSYYQLVCKISAVSFSLHLSIRPSLVPSARRITSLFFFLSSASICLSFPLGLLVDLTHFSCLHLLSPFTLHPCLRVPFFPLSLVISSSVSRRLSPPLTHWISTFVS